MSSLNNVRGVQLTRYLYSKASQNLVPLSGTFELSPICNFDCRMCYVRKTAKEVAESPRNLMTLEQWREIAKQARDQGMLFLLLTGGEPFLWPDFWTLYEELIQMGFLISINTNGSLIDDVVVERLKRLPPWRINITLYGGCDETYQALCGAKNMFNRVAGAIEKLKAAGISVKLNGSLTPHNIADIEKMVMFAAERKLIFETVTYMFPPIRRDPDSIGVNERFTPEEAAHYRIEVFRLQSNKAQLRNYLEQIVAGYIDPPGLDEYCVDPIDGKIRCRAGKASFWITWDGWMTPCGLMPEPKADVSDCDFKKAWAQVTRESAQVALSGVCSKCANQSICHPCAAMAYAETGQSSGIPKYLCEVARYMQQIAAKLLADETQWK